MNEFQSKMTSLHEKLSDQGRRVLLATLASVDSFFDSDRDKARSVIKGDIEIDRIDVEIELESIQLLALGPKDDYQIRSVLTLVKVNNELERIADCAVSIGESVIGSPEGTQEVPQTFRVMANSVIGMIRDANRALRDGNAELARQVLLFDDTVDRFKREILMNAQAKLVSGEFEINFGFMLLTVTKALERIADHSTNICEQVIYLETGRTVRHDPDGWSEPFEPLSGHEEGS
ncbi:MAG: phosphate signaling complex protein PhoU [Planctomycetota bacterium]|nr:phosphate signaling complex protein PhoU [Planctomycetota bacterium]MEC8735084.1 phosphate signaling complex protein PhoU [Planctomycetota bacterium]